MPKPKDQARGSDTAITEVNARLSEAAEAGAALELILVVKGRIRPVLGRHGGRWRVRTSRGHVVTFRPEFVVAFHATGRAHETAQRSRRPAREEEPRAVKAIGRAG
jgi:hypothetical protein